MIFLGSLVILAIIAFAWDGFQFTKTLVSTLESISATIGAAAVFGAAYFAYQELEEVSKSRHIDVADRLFNELNDPANVAARTRIYKNLKEGPETAMKTLGAEDRDAMKKVLNSLDRVAFLTQEGWIPDDLIMPWMHPMINKSWEKLEPFVLYEREKREEPYYYENAEELAVRCRKWSEKHLTMAERTNKWVNDAL